MKEKIMWRILAVILFLIWVGGIVWWLLFWWTIWLVLSVFIFWMATFFAFLRLWWNIWNSWDKWIHVWIGVFMLAFCWIFATLVLEGFASNDGFVFGVVFVIAFFNIKHFSFCKRIITVRASKAWLWSLYWSLVA